ncbi:ORC-CDC6 family AAA ATPase [Duganella hordei]|uniref:ORC-CDC6 family AAA ATPase n=1 Tax=Duganella hordei TaxID=2865934 RepID=UPI0030E950E1
MRNNPFTVSSPEMMDAAEMRRLYVPLAEDFEINGPGHIFVHGHRGCGKSMMLRLLAPDCKAIELNLPLTGLPFLGVYATIKSTDLDISEFERIKNQYAGLVLAEHSLTLFVASKVLQSLKDHTGDYLNNSSAKEELNGFLEKYVFQRLKLSESNSPPLEKRLADPLQFAIEAVDSKYGELIDYLRQLSLLGDSAEYTPFTGRVVGYREFLFPLCSSLTQMECMPTGPVFILLDDADNLNALQTQVLNTWVSYRTGNKICFKISTQLGYKHYRTSSNTRIESPHDFKEVNISTIYTGGASKGSYPKWVEDIVTKRLAATEINAGAKEFFPPSEAQENAIAAIKKKYKDDFELSGRGFRPGDDATRYARPDYIKSLIGSSKQGSTYLYAGFEQLVHISSGIIRYFLDDAASMYAAEMKLAQVKSGETDIKLTCISPAIQDQVTRSSADALMIDNLDRLLEEADLELVNGSVKNDFKQLRNLIQGLGGIFQSILLSDRSERRVFSIALSDAPSDNVVRILKLAVRHGYLYDGAIGSKDGRWRTRKYVMTRRLAPTFKLDPTGFAGYLFVTSDLLETAILNPVRAIREFTANRLGNVVDDSQLSLELES